ncbi:MAG: hypothetical protein VYD87_10710 [Pseudomonadota bacterium]|nr:hypothetical protein [Pseudomonadota bacterium]
MEFETTEAAAGQPLDLRITALVPTFMPRPPDRPGLEAPDLLARPPARAAHPVSETVDGETWSGVSRRWRLIPIADKAFALTGRTVRVAWSDPESGAAKTADLALPPLEFRRVRPKGTEDMDPFLAARRLTLTRTVERIAAGAAGTAGEGDAAGNDAGKTGAGEAEPTPRPQPPATASSSPSSPRRRGCRACSCPRSPRSRSSTASPPIRTRPGWLKPTAAQAAAGRGRSGWR